MPGRLASEDKRAVVVGGSLAGLFSALLLRKIGWDVDVFERIPAGLAGRGAGIVTHPELWAALHRTGAVWDPATLGVSVVGRLVLSREGDIVGERAYRQTMTSWGRLYSILRAALPDQHYHSGRTLAEISSTGSQTTAHLENGDKIDCDLLIGADGIYSTVRRQFFPTVQPTYAGYVAWRGLVEERDLLPETWKLLGDRLAFCLPPGEQMLGYPVAGANDDVSPGRRRYNFVWYRPASENGELQRLLTDRHGKHHQPSIPPQLIRDELIAEIREDASRLLAPHFAEVVYRTERPFIQPVFDVETPKMSFQRVVLVGDAAFVARPHLGMGVTKAAGDAIALSSALEEDCGDCDAAIARFNRSRCEFGTAAVARARHLGAYMQAQLKSPSERAWAEQHRTADAIMTETASPDGILTAAHEPASPCANT
jgi:2-polyprenyl-6-methoxyphenol hydroxylase-like FAD-dependent oxidoreductase